MKIIKNIFVGFFGIGAALLMLLYTLRELIMLLLTDDYVVFKLFWYKPLLPFLAGLLTVIITFLIILKDKYRISKNLMVILWVAYLIPALFFIKWAISWFFILLNL